jgi:hypothetical protein
VTNLYDRNHGKPRSFGFDAVYEALPELEEHDHEAVGR